MNETRVPVQGAAAPTDRLRWMQRPLPAQYALSIGAMVVALWVRWLLDPLLEDRVPYLLAFAALLVLVLVVRPGPFIAAAVLGGAGSWYLFIARGYAAPQPRLGAGIDAMMYACAAVLAVAAAWLSNRAQDSSRQDHDRALAQSELLRVTLSSIREAVITTDPLGRVTFMNGVAAELTGWTTASARGRPLPEVFRIFHEATGAPMTDPVQRVLAHGHVVGLANHTVLRSRTGARYAIEDSGAPIRGDQGEVIGVVLAFRDVTEKRAAHKALERSERELADFFDNASVGLQWIGADGTILRANGAMLDLLGLESSSYVGHHAGEFHVDEEAVARLLRRVASGETVRDFAAQLRCRDGTVKDVLITSSGFFEDGVFVHSRCFTLDVTERKHAEQALRESERRFRLLADAAPVLIWMSDAKRQCTWLNRKWLEFVGRPMEAELGLGWAENVHPEDLERCLTAHAVLHDDRPLSAEYRLRRRDGEYRWLREDAALRYEPDGRVAGFIGACVDVTDFRHAMGALQEADRGKDAFLATLAHEIRDPLAPIRNSLEILRREEAEAGARASALRTLDRHLGHLVRLVDELLDIGRISQGRIVLDPVRLDLGRLLNEVVDARRDALARAGHEVMLAASALSLVVEGDRGRLAQVFGKLIDHVVAGYGSPHRVRIQSEQEGRDAVVRVIEETAGGPRLLDVGVVDPTASAPPLVRDDGAGIGLTLVQRLVEMHGGSVSGFGSGTVGEFVVRLPAVETAIPSPEPTKERTSSSARVLVVDDNRDSATSLAMLLGFAGNETTVAHDGIEALAAVEAFGPDVVLLDIGLPRMDGLEAARRIRAREGGENLVLVALTGWGHQADRARSDEAGFDAHLVKPVDPGSLVRLLSQLRERRDRRRGRPESSNAPRA